MLSPPSLGPVLEFETPVGHHGLNTHFTVSALILMSLPFQVPGISFSFLLYYIYFFNLFYFIYFWLRQVFVAACGLSLVPASDSSLWCAGFSLRWLLLLQSTGSRHVGFSSCGSRALEHRLSSCGAPAQLLRSMWDLPRPGLKPMSLALAGGFLTTAPPGRPQLDYIFLKHFCYILSSISVCEVGGKGPFTSAQCAILPKVFPLISIPINLSKISTFNFTSLRSLSNL